MSSESPARDSAAGLPLAAAGATLGALICVNAYIRLTAFIPEYLYGLNYVYAIFSVAVAAMFGSFLAWAGAVAAASGERPPSPKSASALPEYPNRNLTAMRHPEPPRPPSEAEIASRYPKPPRPPSLKEIAKRHPEPPSPPSADEIAKRHPEPPRPLGLDVSPYEATWRTRAAGERRLDARLAERLPSDDWILISGYRGSGGAIDRVIAGPLGVCALNVLHITGRVSVNSHSWRLQRYNSDGVWVESTKIADEYGRSPSAQVNQFAKSLEDLLASRKLVNRVNRGVVLTHEKSRLDSVFNPPVEFIRSVDALSVGDMFGYRGALLAGASADDVARVVIADHEEFSRDSETP